MGLRIAVQQQQRRALAAGAQPHMAAWNRDIEQPEAGEKPGHVRFWLGAFGDRHLCSVQSSVSPDGQSLRNLLIQAKTKAQFGTDSAR
jgi:hypothetical protein